MWRAELPIQEVKRILVEHFMHSEEDNKPENFTLEVTWPDLSEGLMLVLEEKCK